MANELARLMAYGRATPQGVNAQGFNALADSFRSQQYEHKPLPPIESLQGHDPLTDWALGVRGRMLNPLVALAGEAQRISNMSPDELAGQFGGGGVAGIVSPSVARGLNVIKNIPESQLFKDAVSNTPGTALTEEGLFMNLQRSQHPNQAMNPSVRGGVFYLPEGAAQGKYYSTGKSGYGGTEKITGETLIRNPLFVKGATGGKAPEAAIDQLLGKGTYQDIRTKAIKAYGRYGASEAEKINNVREFLDNYSPELSDQAENIVRNSKQGNQLAYALQEAAVSSAVRKAGYDTVIGQSKGKSGPFISEVYDVRESHYPDKFGGSQIWEDYNK